MTTAPSTSSPAPEIGSAVRLSAHLTAAVGVVLVGLLGLVGIIEASANVYEEQSLASAAVGEIFGSVTAGQTLVARYPGLCRIEVGLATYGRQNEGSATFHLRSSPGSGADLVTVTIGLADVQDTAYQAFEFPPIEDSAGSLFYFYLEAPEAAPGNAITAVGTALDVYPAGEAVIEGLGGHSVRDLTFRLVYEPPLRGRIAFFLDRMVASKPSVLGDKKLYVGLAGAYLALLYVFILRLAAQASAEPED